MTTNIQYVRMLRSEAMDIYVNKKLEKLGKKYEWVISANVHFEKENDPSDKGKICKIELSLPGPRIFAVSNETTFENAVKQTIRDLEIQLKKRKHTFAGR